jgi:V/A-type H+-transporting ATPase subunit K
MRKGARILALAYLATVALSASALAAATIETISKPHAADPAIDFNAALALFAASLSVVGSTFAAGWALRSVASAGFAAAAEKPEVATWMLIMGGLAEGIAIYGLLVAILIITRL